MRGEHFTERESRTLHTPLPKPPENLIQHRLTDETELPPLDSNGVIGSDPSGLDQEFNEPTAGQGE